MADQIVFLPGAGGDGNFWAPVNSRLATPGERVLITWPGFAGSPRDPRIASLRDLVPVVEKHLTDSTTLVAQSMGGVVAVITALADPEHVSRLVLVATSGGIDMASDWRPRYVEGQRSKLPSWFVDDRTDFTGELAKLTIPTLLIYGDADDIAPVAAGEFLWQALHNATLEVIEGGEHDMANQRADEIAALIDRFVDG